MYSKKSVRSKMKPWGTPVLTEFSCEDFPTRTTWSCPLLRKEEVSPNIWDDILWKSGLLRRPACQTMSKALDISSATAGVAPVLKTLAILPDTNVRRSVVDREDLKP